MHVPFFFFFARNQDVHTLFTSFSLGPLRNRLRGRDLSVSGLWGRWSWETPAGQWRSEENEGSQ